MNNKVNLIDITKSFSTNDDGLKLYHYMDKVIKSNSSVVLKINFDSAFSSSFLNSSFGEIISIHGIDSLKDSFKIETSNQQFKKLKIYIDKYMQLVCA
jgi:hypothetical protein